MKMKKIVACFCALAVAAFVCAGCDQPTSKGSRSKWTAPVQGTITMNGEPLVGATVEFNPNEYDPKIEDASMGVTDASGKYVIKTGAKDGCPDGSYRISLSKVENDQQVLIQYCRPIDSGLTAEVSSSSSTFDFDLK